MATNKERRPSETVAALFQELADLAGNALRPLVNDEIPIEVLLVVDTILDEVADDRVVRPG